MTTEREARRAAEAASELGGARIKTLGSTGGFVLVLILGVVAILGMMLARELALAYLVVFFVIGLFVVWYLRAVSAVRINNEGVSALLRGDDRRAAERFRALVSHRTTRENAAMGLHNLGVVALRAGNAKSAVAIFRAAHAVSAAAFRLRRTPDAVTALVRAHLGFALAATGDLDAAERELSLLGTGDGATHLPMALAYGARAKAFVALKRDKPEDAVAALDEERALLANVLTGNESMLAEAMLAVALARLGGTWRGEPRPPGTVWVDEEAARFIFAFLPEAKDHLAIEPDS